MAGQPAPTMKPKDNQSESARSRHHFSAEDNPLFPFPDRLPSVFSALDEKANS
jgi:hypothetical protein